jgi:hypothetical protein
VRCIAWLDARIFGWIFGEPVRDLGHVRLDRTRYRQVEHSGSYVTAVLEVVRDATRDKNE